jgi:hypothetical protein
VLSCYHCAAAGCSTVCSPPEAVPEAQRPTLACWLAAGLRPPAACGCGLAAMVRKPPPNPRLRMWILHNRVTLGPYITDTRARTRYWSSTNHRNPKEPSHDSSRRYYICRLRVHVTRAAVDVGSLACLLLRNATIVCNRRGWYVDTGAWNRIYTVTLP